MVGHSRWTGEQAEFVQHSRGLPAQGVLGTSDNERLLGSFLAVGVNHGQNKERTKARQARRKDLHKFCSNIKKHDSQPYERGLRDVIVVLLAVQ